MVVSSGSLAFGKSGPSFDTAKCAAYVARHVPACKNAKPQDICGAALSTKDSAAARACFCHLSSSDPANHGANGKFHSLPANVREALQDFAQNFR